VKHPAGARIARFAAFEFDLTTTDLRRDGRRVRLAPQPARVLAALVQRQGELVSREELKPAVWTKDTFVEFDQGLTFCIKRLRATLGDDARSPRFIETIPKRGYRFIAAVSIEEPAASPAPPEPEIAIPAHTPLLETRANGTARHPLPFALIASVVVIAAAVAFYGRSLTTGATAPVRLAVLPFANLTGDPLQEYVSEGFVEELISQLNRVEPKRLAVVGRSSSTRYAGPQRDIAAIAKELDVVYLVEGSVRRDGQRLRITSQLVDARRRMPVWSNTYERDAADLLLLQEDVAAAIAREVGISVGDPVALARRRVDPRANELYLQARFFWNRRTTGVTRARELFSEALGIDPQFARAHAGMGDIYMSGGMGIPGRAIFLKALAAADRALTLDDRLSEAHVTRAHALTHLFDWNAAERAYRRAIELDPNYVPARYLFAEWMFCRGRFAEAIREGRRARELDPVSAIATHVLGVVHLFARDYDEAAALFTKALELDPGHRWSRDRLVQTHEACDAAAAARAELERLENMGQRNVLLPLRLEARWGDKVRAKTDIDAATSKGRPAYAAVWAYAALGDADAAFKFLDHAFTFGHYELVFLATDPRLDSLRNDPRFGERLQRAGLARLDITKTTR